MLAIYIQIIMKMCLNVYPHMDDATDMFAKTLKQPNDEFGCFLNFTSQFSCI